MMLKVGFGARIPGGFHITLKKRFLAGGMAMKSCDLDSTDINSSEAGGEPMRYYRIG